MVKRLTRAKGDDFTREFIVEQGEFVRKETQELGPAMRRSKLIRDVDAERKLPGGRHYIGSIPVNLLHDWLKERGFTVDQFARNEGGDPYKTNPHHGGGVKDQFLKHFLSRDYSKLHTQHTTTRRESNRIVVPDKGPLNAERSHLHGAETGDS